MVNPLRSRTRVLALRRAAEGSAFQKCDVCGFYVAIALQDMHDCEVKRPVKRFKGCGECVSLIKPSFRDQPRSPFCLFIESFRKDYKAEQWLEADRKGFEMLKNMSEEEKLSFVMQAEEVNMAYEGALLEEIADESEVDDEADSGMVGKFDSIYEYWETSEDGSLY